MPLKIIPDNTKIPFTKWRRLALAFSAALVAASIVAVMTLGLNFGVDFRGGVTIEVVDDQPIDIGRVRSTVSDLGLGNVKVQAIQDFAGSEEGVLVVVEQQRAEGGAEENEAAQQRASEEVQAALRGLLGEGIEFRKIEVVGPTVSGELIQRGAIAVMLAIGMMLIYIWFRFEWQFSLGAIVALVHDVIITLGMFAATRLEFNLSIIAAILTIVGYSMNDTVVVYDRVRENLRKYKKKPLPELLDLSINDTLSRTIMTSGTTLLALLSLYVLGGEVLRGFTFAMIWGIVIGTYSSIFVAAPFLTLTGVRREWGKAAAAAATP
ncbi:protein translocase subunit SecF [Amphiplicatus metriothermophilus]|uniref:Protein-export membrane protein SecF n=1 Tax=Amphiplicatus metriothermophilus TaxID=1519374 RepID=A0A239PQS9_9PROT|nr:protein translocase subunit SecF [Amphiplicatus metriothermophilus]MBB5518341.1 preprotein translocase SecF subunit [Amphiplicatus metriothermophilus]SNT72488.1 protein translocase subunit secF [Amphiplicatus metriothermophilus]